VDWLDERRRSGWQLGEDPGADCRITWTSPSTFAGGSDATDGAAVGELLQERRDAEPRQPECPCALTADGSPGETAALGEQYATYTSVQPNGPTAPNWIGTGRRLLQPRCRAGV